MMKEPEILEKHIVEAHDILLRALGCRLTGVPNERYFELVNDIARWLALGYCVGIRLKDGEVQMFARTVKV
jgi:hypothetical protein